MVVSQVTTAKFIKQSVLLIRDLLRDNLTDPIASERPAGEKYVLTAYPQENTRYPVITVRSVDGSTVQRLGMKSEMAYVELLFELRCWARNEEEKDSMTQDSINVLRSKQHDADGTTAKRLHDPLLLSMNNLDEPGDSGIKSKIVRVSYKFILGQAD